MVEYSPKIERYLKWRYGICLRGKAGAKLSKRIRCNKCGRPIAEKRGAFYYSKKRGRTFIAPAGAMVICECCGERNRMGAEFLELSDFAQSYPITIESLREICQTVCEFVSCTQLTPEQIEHYFFEDKEHTKPVLRGEGHAKTG